MLRIVLMLMFLGGALPAHALDLDAPFEAIEGGELSLSEWRGQPVLLVNTASRCGFTGQYEGLQALYDSYRDQGLVVLAVPSSDFRQELASNTEVKQFCDAQFGLDFPMTTITSVKGDTAHPVYKTLKAEAGFVPRWNFYKVLIAPDGTVAATYSAMTKPGSSKIRRDIEALLK